MQLNDEIGWPTCPVMYEYGFSKPIEMPYCWQILCTSWMRAMMELNSLSASPIVILNCSWASTRRWSQPHIMSYHCSVVCQILHWNLRHFFVTTIEKTPSRRLTSFHKDMVAQNIFSYFFYFEFDVIALVISSVSFYFIGTGNSH